MPAGAPGSLTDAEYIDIIAYMLRVNDFPAGREELRSRGQVVVTAAPSSCNGVRLNEPGTEYLGAVNQLDISVSSSFVVGRVRVRPMFDLFNALNSGAVLDQTNVYGPSLGDPRRLLFPRVARFGARIDF